jgi:hypothetical protein
MRSLAATDFEETFDDERGSLLKEEGPNDWRQRLWENVMLCKGLTGLGMMRPQLRNLWVDKVRLWKDQISKLPKKSALVMVEERATLEYPYILGDLRLLSS